MATREIPLTGSVSFTRIRSKKEEKPTSTKWPTGTPPSAGRTSRFKLPKMADEEKAHFQPRRSFRLYEKEWQIAT